MASESEIQPGILGFLFAVVLMANLIQLASHWYLKRNVPTIPLSTQRIAVAVCSCFMISLWLEQYGPHNDANVISAIVFFHLALIFKTWACSFVTFEATRNAYLAMYLHSKTLSPLLFQLSALITVLLILASLILQLITSKLAYNSLALFAFALFLFAKIFIGIYFNRQLQASASSSATEGLKNYFRTTWVMTPILLGLVAMFVWLAVVLAMSPADIYHTTSSSEMRVNLPAVLVLLGQFTITNWAWKPLRPEISRQASTEDSATASELKQKSNQTSRASTTKQPQPQPPAQSEAVV